MKIESVVLVVFCISSYLWTLSLFCMYFHNLLFHLFTWFSYMHGLQCLHGLQVCNVCMVCRSVCVVCSVCAVCSVRMVCRFEGLLGLQCLHGLLCLHGLQCLQCLQHLHGLQCLHALQCLHFLQYLYGFQVCMPGFEGLHGLHGLQCLLGLLWLLCLSFECSNSHDSVMNGRATWTSITVVFKFPRKTWGATHVQTVDTRCYFFKHLGRGKSCDCSVQ